MKSISFLRSQIATTTTLEQRIISNTKVLLTGNSMLRRHFTKSTILSKGPTLIELFQTFPSGVRKLYNDYQTYHNINDAATTKLNAWSVPESNYGADGTMMRGRVPRRQQEQQKRFLRDVRKVTLPVTLALLPIVGNSILLILVIRPYAFLSDHFFTIDQVRYFLSKGYRQRKMYFDASAKDVCRFLDICQEEEDFLTTSLTKVNDDTVVFQDAIQLYSRFQQKFRNKDLLQDLSRREILNITYASWLASPTLFMQPVVLIKYRLGMLIRDIIQDDISLIREGHHLEQCKSLTSHEIVDACSVRNLPCDLNQTTESMRGNLSHHLRNIEQVLIHVGEDVFKQSVSTAYFILYIPIIQQHVLCNK